MSDRVATLYGSLQTLRNRYVYFLLAIAAGSIAFAITQTDESRLSISQLPLGLAVIFWSLSFFSGCRNQVFHGQIQLLNLEILRVKEGAHEISGSNADAIRVGADYLKERIKEAEKPQTFHAKWQFWFYIFGAILFIIWHICEMYLRAL